VEANAVFAILPPERIAPLQEQWFFHVWDDRRHEVRWMTAWDTTEADVDGFVGAVKKAEG
jgi:threonine aldolase